MLYRSAPSSVLPYTALVQASTLRLCAVPETICYEAVIGWETYVNGEYHTSTITKQVALRLQALPEGGFDLDLRTSPPVLAKPEDRQSLESVALQLAALYEWLVIQVAPSGQFLAVSNHDAVCRTWEALARTLQEAAAAGDRITPTLLQFIGQQLQDPSKFLFSLRHDYLYQTLVFDHYDQPAEQPEHSPAVCQLF